MNEPQPIIEELLVECDRQMVTPPLIYGEPDKYIKVFAQSVAGAINDFPDSHDVISRAAEVKKTRSPFSGNALFNSILRLFQMDYMNDSSYPFENIGDWDDRVRDLFSDPMRMRILGQNLIMWNVGSDVETRIAGPKLVAHTLQNDRTNVPEDPFTILNVGSARDHSLAMLSANIELPTIIVAENPKVEEMVNKLLAQEIVIGDCCGVDLWPLRDPEWSDFLEACRYYPSELNDAVKRARYKQLEKIRDADPRLHHADMDFSDTEGSHGLGEVSLYGTGGEDLYDQIVFSTSMYQNYPEKRKTMFKNAVKRCRDTGKIIVQDFLKIDESRTHDNPTDQLDFLGPRSDKFLYTTVVYDMERAEEGFQPFAYWNNGRCEELLPGKLLVQALNL